MKKKGKAGDPAALPATLKHIVKRKKLWGRKRLAQWLSILRDLEAFDMQIETIIKKLQTRMAIFFLLSFIGIFPVVIVTQITNNIFLTGLIAAVFLTILGYALYCTYKYNTIKHLDLANDFRGTLLPVLAILAEDIPEKARVKLDVNLASPQSKQYQVSKKKIPPGPNRKLIETVYRQRCLDAVIPLRNKGSLQLNVTKDLISLERHYKTPRGKYKSKTKWKALVTVSVALTPDPENLAFSGPRTKKLAAVEKLKAFKKNNVIGCRLKRKLKIKGDEPFVVPDSSAPPDVVIEMAVQLCRNLMKKKTAQTARAS